MLRKYIVVLALSAFFGNAYAQTTESRGVFSLHERVEGSVSSLGIVARLDSSLSYEANSHVRITGGVPVYFVHPSASTAAATGAQSGKGVGNVYGKIGLTFPGDVLSYSSTLTATAPTGNRELGFSTGRATVDWSNYLERSFSPFAVFGELGLANSVSDTLFFVRPYVSQGFVIHGQAGGRFQFSNAVGVGGSAYAIRPSGQQTVVSRVAKTQTVSAPDMTTHGNGRGQANRPVFETAVTTTGSADIARDNGVSAWIKISPARSLDLYAGYTRSTQFALNTAFFGIELTVADIFGRGR